MTRPILRAEEGGEIVFLFAVEVPREAVFWWECRSVSREHLFGFAEYRPGKYVGPFRYDLPDPSLEVARQPALLEERYANARQMIYFSLCLRASFEMRAVFGVPTPEEIWESRKLTDYQRLKAFTWDIEALAKRYGETSEPEPTA